jgi:hypothetical protein
LKTPSSKGADQSLFDLARHTERFFEWERVGRGTTVYPHLVALEPRFKPFLGYRAVANAILDDGRRPTFFSRVWDRIARRDAPFVEPASSDVEEPVERAEVPDGRITEFELLIPPELKIDPNQTAAFLQAVASSCQPLAFELIGVGGRVFVQLACAPEDARLVRGQLTSLLPTADIVETDRTLVRAWKKATGDAVAGVDFVLAREFVVPLPDAGKGSSWISALVAALAEAGENEIAAFQVLFTAAHAPWASSAMNAVTSPDGAPFFVDAPEITKLAEEKFSDPLFAVAVRALAVTQQVESGRHILRSVAAALSVGGMARNRLEPAPEAESDDFEFNTLLRCTNRSGMILSLPELAALARLPGAEVRHPALVRTRLTTRLPEEVIGDTGVVVGEGEHDGTVVPVRLPLEARLSHTYVIGASGTGKSTLLQQMILQDIESGRGVAVLDPHGDLVDEVLARIPEHRVEDVVLFDPSDPDYVVGWNILGAHSDVEKEMLASDLVAVWKRLSTSWGDQMSAVLGNAVLAFLESSVGGTLTDLRQFLLDDKFRAAFLGTVRDEHIRSFWKDEFSLLVGKKPQAPILTRLDTFLRSRMVREAVVEREKPLDFRAIMDGKKIFLGRLAQGAIGEENAALLGSLLVSKFHQVALSRQDVAKEEREPFMLFMDEFQSFATPSMASLFSGVRKYKLALCVAHQDLYQLHGTAPELERSILSSAYTRIVFRISEEDARKLERGMGEFGEADLVNLERGHAICRVGSGANSFKLRTAPLDAVAPALASARIQRVRSQSAATFARRRTPADTDTPGARPTPSSAPQPGRGGREHKYLQGLIKRGAEERGYSVVLEKAVLDGHGHVDVSLTSGSLSIACEISITTPAAHELDNVSKCLAAGYRYVVFVSSDSRKLAEVAKRYSADGSSEDQVRFLTPSALFAFLDRVRSESAANPTPDAAATSAKRERQSPRPPAIEIPTDPKALLDTEQTAAYIRRAPQTLAKLRSVGGGPPFVKIGRNVYYVRADLDEWLAVRRRRSTSDVPPR